MSHSLTFVFTHIIFTTKNRAPFLTPTLEARLFRYLSGIVQNSGSELLEAGGVSDHVHLLVRVSANVSIASLVNKVKANSSRWVRRREPSLVDFSWQNGYGAFTVGPGDVDRVCRYIQGQKDHHRKWSFEEELGNLLGAHDLTIGIQDIGRGSPG